MLPDRLLCVRETSLFDNFPLFVKLAIFAGSVAEVDSDCLLFRRSRHAFTLLFFFMAGSPLHPWVRCGSLLLSAEPAVSSYLPHLFLGYFSLLLTGVFQLIA